MGKDARRSQERDHFQDPTPLYPEKQMVLKPRRDRIASRMLDLIVRWFWATWTVAPPKAREDRVYLKKSLMESQQIIQAELIIYSSMNDLKR